MPRGGKRLGAGAPRGNLNAVKHGRFSPRILLLVLALMKLPLFRHYLLRQLDRDMKNLKRREQKRQLDAFARAIATQVISSGVLHNANNQTETPREIQNG